MHCHRFPPHLVAQESRGTDRGGRHCNRAPSVLDYYSDSPTFALAASPLSTSSATSLRLAIGSYSETRVPTASSSSTAANSTSASYTNHLTVAAVDPAVADLEDDSDSESETAYRSRSTRQRVRHLGAPSSGSAGAFRAVARTPLLYPPSAVQFAPARLSGSLASGTGGNAGYGEPEQREVLATSSESLRLWDLVTEQDDGGRAGSGNGFVGGGGSGGATMQSSRSRLVSRATLQNVSTASRVFPFMLCLALETDLSANARLLQSKAEFSAPLTGFSWSMLEPTQIVTASIDTVSPFLPSVLLA